MAVSVDTVYQRVLTLANKEQRGYITPQEFNLLANQAQMEIFEQYFYDIKQFNRIPGNMEGYSDPLSILYEKIGEFELERDGMWMQTNMLVVANQFIDIPWDEIYKINSVRVGNAQVDMLNGKDFDSAMSLPLTRPTLTRPIGCITAQDKSWYGQLTTKQWNKIKSIKDKYDVADNCNNDGCSRI